MRPLGFRQKRIAAFMVVALVLLAFQVGALEPPTGLSLSPQKARLFPIGWSRDGKFAFALVDEPAFRGGFGFLWAIMDTRTDEMLWSQYNHSDEFEWQGDDAPVAIAWRRTAPTIAEQLAAFGVEEVSDERVEALPLLRGTDAYTATVSEWRVNPETSPYGNGVVGYTLSLHSRERGTKLIAQRGQIFATDVKVQGYVRSPFENRIVLLVAESGNAYGGTRFTDFTFIGAHLDVGFQQ